MKTTEIHVRGFDMFFTVEVKKKEYLTIEEAKSYVLKEITSTAEIVKVIHKGDEDVVVKNPDYKMPFKVSGKIAKQYLKI